MQTDQSIWCSARRRTDEDARTYGINFNLKGQDWVGWCIPRFVACLRVCKGLIAWVVEGKTKRFRWSATPALLMADLHRQGVCLRKPPAFHRVGIPGSGGPDWLRNDYEFIVCATNGGKLPWSDNTAMGHIPKYGPGGPCSHRLPNGARVNQWGGSEGKRRFGRKRDGSADAHPRPSHRFGVALPAIANPGNVVSCGSLGGGRLGDRLAHDNEAPFPESLAEFFIRSFCPPGGVVLDPFCGSGTSLAVALKTGRRGIGIDIRESQIILTRKRLASVSMAKLDVDPQDAPLLAQTERPTQETP